MLKGAIIGFGKIARSSHMDAYKNDSFNGEVEITSAIEPNPNNFQISQKEFPAIRFYHSLEELLDNEAIDFVDITCPPQYHFEMLEKCIAKGLNILCEKPFTLNLKEAEIIREKLLNSSIVFMPCHQYKYSPIWCEFKSFIDSQEDFCRPLLQFNVFRTQADPGLETLSDKWRKASIDTGGGILVDTGIHYLYLVNWMLGNPVRIMSNLTTLQHLDYNCEDTAIIVLESPKGAAQITVTWAADKRYNDAKLVCKNGSIYYEGGTKLLKSSSAGIEEIPVPDASDKKNYALQYVSMFRRFFDAVKNNQQNINWIDEAYQSILLLNKCYESSNSNNR
ncbi:MAG: Gfo/Idh/MocA family oxidoreductase [Ignavibacteriaceae bacterium]|nr:Gfo/Idh/MocA family oxidoreductase [Ignavibacteriaceae bacterium]